MKIPKPLLLATLVFSLGLCSLADDFYVRTRAERDAMTPQEVVQSIQAGNERFVSGQRRERDFLREQQATATGQHPSAVILACIDSRAPAEMIFDKGIGEIFNARIAGNVLNPDLAGSLEFACAAAGAKAIVVMGHSGCGAVAGAIDGVELGNLTGLLARIQPAVEAVADVPGPRESSNQEFFEAVTRKNVELTVAEIRSTSPLLRDMEEKGDIVIVGALHDLHTGKVEFLD